MSSKKIRRRPDDDDAELRALKAARKKANRRIFFLGHLVLWLGVSAFLLVVAGFFPALVVALAWGVFLSAHGFFFVIAPELRRTWVDREVRQRVHSSVTTERRALEGKHSRSIEELAASVAHEVRNPVTAAKSLVQQIGEDPGGEETAEYARIAVEELDRVEQALSHLLRYAREEPLRLAPTHLADVIDSALETLKDRVDRSAVRVTHHVDSGVVLDADADKLRRVVINLIGNAIDAFEESEFPNATVDIEAGEDLAGQHVWLKVRDNGPGMEAAETSKVFNPFYTTKKQGTGLGLAITKKLVEAHGGTIEISSDLGSGTELVMTFPKYTGSAPGSA